MFDWRQTGPQTWEIVIETADGEKLHLENGGAKLSIDGKLVVEEKPTEYEQIYERFRELLDAGQLRRRSCAAPPRRRCLPRRPAARNRTLHRIETGPA